MKDIDFFDLKLCEKIGLLFEYAIFHEGYDRYSFTRVWLHSDVFMGILEWDVALVSQAYTYIFGKFIDEIEEKEITIPKKDCDEFPECINWIGYTMTYWCILEEIHGKDITENYDIDRIIDNSFIYHTQSVKTAIRMIKEEMKV